MSQLPIFGVSAPNEELIHSYQVDIGPSGDLSNHGPIEFNIVGNADFTDLSATTLHLTVKVVKGDTTVDSTGKQEVALTNNALHSMFADVIVTVNETIIEGGEQNYYLKAMIGTLFAYSDTTIEKQLFSVGFVKDEAGKADDVLNSGYTVRKSWTAAGASKEFYGKLFVDMFKQSRYLIGNVNMRIKLIKNPAAMALWTNAPSDKPKIIIEQARLYLRKVRPHPQILNDMELNLSRGGIVHYPINRTEINIIPAAAGLLKISKEQLFYGKVPKLLVMAMLDTEAASGVYNKNPFNFKHCFVKAIDLRIDGESKPILPLTPNFKTKQCTREYMSVLESMNILAQDACLPFTYAEFLNGYTFFA